MSIFAVAWVYMAGLLLTVAIVGALAASRRPPAQPLASESPQVKWRCPICAYVFIEFEVERYQHCPRCDTLLDAESDATVTGGTEPGPADGAA